MQIPAADGPLQGTALEWTEGVHAASIWCDGQAFVYRNIGGAGGYFPTTGDPALLVDAWCAAIEDEVNRRIDAGFWFLPAGADAPLLFALGQQDQIMLLGLGASLPTGGVTPPIPVFTRDNRTQIVLSDPSEIAAYLAAATLTIAGQREIGRTMKEMARNAADPADVAVYIAAYLSGWSPL